MTIVSKVSLTLALIIESALPDFSHFEFAKIRFLSYLCKYFFFVFVCKSTTIMCSLFARCFYYSSILLSRRALAASKPLRNWCCSSSFEGSSVIYWATFMPDLSSCSSSICSSPPSVQSNNPRGCSSPGSSLYLFC